MTQATLTAIPENPVPAGGETCFLYPDGAGENAVQVRAALFPRSAGVRARGSLILLNGRNEFIEKYFEVITELTARGFDVATLDWRGQGLSTRALSDRLRGHVTDFAEFDRDLAALIELARQKFAPPFVMLAHSMGGQIALRGLSLYPALFSRAALSAPMLAVRMPMWMRPVARGVARGAQMIGRADEFAPGGEKMHPFASEFPVNPVTHDEKRFLRNRAILTANMDLMIAGPTLGWFGAANRAMALTAKKDFARSLTMPLLLTSVGHDVFVQSKTIEKFAHAANDAVLLHVGAAKHELLMERDELRALFYGAFDAFCGL